MHRNSMMTVNDKNKHVKIGIKKNKRKKNT